MRIAVLGTGVVGRTLGTALAGLGHEVIMGSRTRDNESAVDWAARTGEGASQGSFADAAAAAEVVVNATGGAVSQAALEAAGSANLAGKVVIDVSNPLVPRSGMPPAIEAGSDDSLGERIQRAFPRARVVKTLNTVTADVMVNPSLVRGVHTMFVCGDDAGAKGEVTDLLVALGWSRTAIVDLGDITGARAVEMYLALWLRLMLAQGTAHFNIEVRRA